MSVLLLSSLWIGAAKADEPQGIQVTIQVLDAATGAPIPTASVGLVEGEDRYRVNHETGQWIGSGLYRADGSELVFVRDAEIAIEVLAPGYEQRRISHTVHKRRNTVEVELQQVQIDTSSSLEGVRINFKHDKLLD
ncbi:MAG TPA: hypothetical protein ENK18_13665 [Deltaproteobacteria bacterium]|nr:hypothetical protein [Deltaproteobacteria bacterium]